jgi:hypothetical protein
MSHFNQNKQSHSLMSGIGAKVKSVAEFAGTVKGLYDLGRSAYAGFQVISPYIAEAALLLA